MKKILSLITFILLLPSIAFAQALPIRNDSDANLRDLGSDRQVGKNFSVDQTGRQKIVLSAGTASATNPVKLEDSVAADGDAGVFSLFIRNNAGAALAGANGDYSGASVNQFGSVIAGPSLTNMGTADITSGILKPESGTSANADALVSIGAVVRSGDNAQALDGQYTNLSTDLRSALLTTLAPAGQTWQACSAAETGTASRTIKAGVASNRNYITQITCRNTSAIASGIDFLDGGAGISVGGVGALAVTGGTFIANFPVPLRGTVNTALNFQMLTTATSTVCCASGYISVN